MRIDEDLAPALVAAAAEPSQALRGMYGRLALSMPLGKDGPPPTAYVCWSNLLVLAERTIGGIALCHGWRMPVSASRTTIVEAFLKTGYEWLVQIDYDMVFDPRIVFQLCQDVLDHPDIKMVSGTAKMGGAPHTPAIYNRVGDIWKPIWSWPKERLFTAARVGLFGHIAHRSVFEAIPPPWYSGIDECWWFCDRVGEAGIKIWVDPRAPFGHIGERIVPGTPDRYSEVLDEAGS